MRLKRCATSIAVLAVVLLSTAPCLLAQMVVQREYHGKQILCGLSGLRGFASPCGLDGNYAYIFIGSVLSVAGQSDTEKRLQLRPQEIFLGAPVGELMVTTSQGDCLGDIQPGNRWLFYLQRDKATNQLVLAYGSPSGTFGEGEEDIARLRRLTEMTNLGIIRGYIDQPIWNDDEHGFESEEFRNVPNHKVVVTRESDGAEHWAFTGTDGNFEFEPLPSGKYHVTANTAQGLWAEEGSTEVRSQGCSMIQFELRPDGRISGYVGTANGKPFKVQPWVNVVSEELGESRSTYVNEEGYFEVKGLRPGRYLVGIGIQAEPGSPKWPSRVYYPGVRTRESVVIIELGQAEKRTDINFRLLK
ncbi:MAG TPA: carboxypeptidase-like regulatory domain-containing protein [Candidatus Angelobacter sp.]|nr:carboxypeptidase-like regulatory domain-containing protein [Candidatus Angelobacter sp.]